MKNKKSIYIITLFLIIIMVIITGIIYGKKQKLVSVASTTVEQRKLWNEFLNSNPYLSQMEKFSESYISETDLVKLAITSDNVITERIVTSEIEKRPSLTLGDGYKKSFNNINNYIKNLLDKEEIAYNFVETHANEDDYLLIGEDYVYFTKIEIPEKMYIAVEYKEENGKYEVQIYEYDVTEENRENLKEVLNTGKINKRIKISKTYILTGQINNDNITINSKEIL